MKAVGESGCGYEAPLESWYRFLIDPEPPESIKQSGGLSTSTGVDQTVLAQRAAFLRPDSAVAIVMLTDENDCSIRDDGQAWLVSTFGSDIPRATSQCAVDPDDSCCRSCGQADPAGCPSSKSDPECMKGNYDQATEDTPNLRCWEQKRRFGVDWLYPTQRYVDALTSSSVMSRSDMKVPNPLLASGRSSYQVFLIGIVGVPWQLVSTDESQTDPSVLEYESANQIDWAKITKSGNQPPTDPHMVESPTPRAGLPGPSSLPGADPINGHEWSSTSDLNYAHLPTAHPAGLLRGNGGLRVQARSNRKPAMPSAGRELRHHAVLRQGVSEPPAVGRAATARGSGRRRVGVPEEHRRREQSDLWLQARGGRPGPAPSRRVLTARASP